MKVSVQCPHCGTHYRVVEEKLGARAHCKRCSQAFTITLSGSVDDTFAGQATPSEFFSDSGDHTDGPPSISHYVVQRKLGEGMMGEVYLAHDPELDRDVAIKLLPESFARDRERLDRFLREARASASLDHTNVVTVHQAGTDAGRAFIVMQYIDGGSLDQIIARTGAFEWREATRVIREAAAGLAAAHAQGMVHRDVKPANLMRTTAGVTKLVDFGLVRAQAGDSQVTQDGRLLGTPAYMAPEQWIDGEVDARSDLYSLVCSYYYLVTGRVPYDAPSAASLGYLHRYETAPDPREQTEHLPDSVCRILGRGMSKDPTDRYQTADELTLALDAVLSAPQESLTFGASWQQLASPYGIVAPAAVVKTKSARGHRRIVLWNLMAAAISFLVLVGVAAGIIALMGGDPDEGDAPLPMPPIDTDAPAPAEAPFDKQQATQQQRDWAKYLEVPVEREIDLPRGEKMTFAFPTETQWEYA